MEPRISLITLGVTDLERSIRFYRDGLGLPQRDGPAILAWDFDRIVVTHGDVLETGGHDAVTAAFAYLGGC